MEPSTISRLLTVVQMALGHALAWACTLRLSISGVRVALIPGWVTIVFSTRAGVSGLGYLQRKASLLRLEHDAV